MPNEDAVVMAELKEELERMRMELWMYKKELHESLIKNEWLENALKRCTCRCTSKAGSQPGRSPSDTMLLADSFASWGYFKPIEASLEDLQRVADEHDLCVVIHKFSEIQPGQSLQQHVRAKFESGDCPGPWLKDSIELVSQGSMKTFKFPSVEAAKAVSCLFWRGADKDGTKGGMASPQPQVMQWQSHLKNLLSGDYSPYVFRLLWASPGMLISCIRNQVEMPIILLEDGGRRRYWGMLRQALPSGSTLQWAMGLREVLIQKHTPISITVICVESGRILFQNSVSKSMLGMHGTYNGDLGFESKAFKIGDEIKNVVVHLNVEADGYVCLDIEAVMFTRRMRGHVPGDYSYLQLLFDHSQDQIQQLMDSVQQAGHFRTRVQVSNPILRQFMTLRDGVEAHHDVQVTEAKDPLTLQRVYMVSQVDVTEAVQAKRQLQAAHDELAEEKGRMDALLQRQHELIECLGKVGGVDAGVRDTARRVSRVPSVATAALMDGVRQHMKEDAEKPYENIEIMEMLGQGSFGKVYKGIWRGTVVAIKSMVFSKQMSNVEKHERMAIMEAAISSSLSHPNIVQTYTYSLRSISDESAALDSSSLEDAAAGREGRGTTRSPTVHLPRSSGFEVQLVLEYFAADVARGMLHLHTQNVVHSDLKSHNVMLTGGGGNNCGVIAKVADFGLSVKMDRTETHVSKCFQGTLTHMAPEMLLSGHQSKAADVYSFGITLWELWTGSRPFSGLPQALLGHQVTLENLRPTFLVDTPVAYQALAERCWDASVANRPNFEQILGDLQNQILSCFSQFSEDDRATVKVQPSKINSFRKKVPDFAKLVAIENDLDTDGLSSGSVLLMQGGRAYGLNEHATHPHYFSTSLEAMHSQNSAKDVSYLLGFDNCQAAALPTVIEMKEDPGSNSNLNSHVASKQGTTSQEHSRVADSKEQAGTVAETPNCIESPLNEAAVSKNEVSGIFVAGKSLQKKSHGEERNPSKRCRDKKCFSGCLFP
ncbi:hypothetical protein CEUSTIGMA_g5320.t1 [Chlamydomonas eustigma]|uniref:Protein kinase domain-containing protein n=1 Tax=Chlamydomonas eustigma TaxID=1157962 RepID=A0A250X466_9CHLO|nr:hypothetical protein CEUSTIGMA_g5320.t1 [Chlamydomonas eustigma]|eukprot:GAX77878.1 hypothetical protein CEUSTIGMA_g5320.t1 [Chlamydomonas eustigma]